MNKKFDSEIDINQLANNPKAIVELVGHVSALHESFNQAKENAHKERQIFQETIDILDDGFVVYDDEDKLFIFNQAFENQLGKAGKYLKLGHSYKSITTKFAKSGIVPGVKGKEEEFVADLIKQRQSEEGLEKTFQTNTGEWIRQRDKKNTSGFLVGLRTNITDLKNREDELENKTTILRETTNAMVQGMIVFQKGVLNFYNSKLLEILDLHESEITKNLKFIDYMELLRQKGQLGHGDESYANYRKILELAKSGESYSLERTLDGGTYIKVDTVPRDEEFSLVITYTDITDLKEREQELKIARSENDITLARQIKIANAIPQGIIMFENDKIVFFNQQAFDMLELTDDILFEEQTFEKFLSLQDKDGHFGSGEQGQTFAEKHMNVVSVGIPYQLEHSTKSGKNIRVDGIPNKKENSLTLTFTDITSLKQRETELEIARTEAEKLLEIQAASANVMVQGLLFFHDGKLEYHNPKFIELTGAKASEVYIGMDASEILELQIGLTKFESQTALEEHKEETDKNFSSKQSYSLEREMKNGKTLKVDAVVSENNGLVVTYSDITDIKQREYELEETMKVAESAERAKSEFLANMSHEIRTPMNGVMGMAELLASTELDAKQKMFTDVIVKSGASLLTIINDILDFSKIDAGQMELDPAPFNLSEAIEDVATLVSSKVAEKDLELIVRVDPSLPKMMVGDVGRIRQIVTNLLGNAVKFTEKGHVFIDINGTTEKIDGTDIANLKFSIEDTGIGIPEDKCAQVFRKFSQVDTSATRKHEGTGLGLSISSSLVKLMQGDIGVESKVGQGSTFWFTTQLPIHGEAEPKHIVPGDLTGARVLIIDDNKVNRSILKEQMQAWNFDGASTRTGAEGLELMRAVIANNLSLDLVILDYQMPEMSGEEVLATMRSDDQLKDIPVLMLTSVDSSQTNQRLQKLGAEANLTKPTRSSMLLETMLQVIANKRADIKTSRISNLTVRPQPETPNIKLPKLKETNILQDSNQQLDILVAEDNEVNQIVFRQILEETGLNFYIVENGHLALAAYKAKKPRLVLMDVSMPEMNGKEATVAIRKYERSNKTKRTPIVGVTAHALKGDMEACIDAGMDDYLSKPVSPNKLSLKIEQWLKVNLRKAAKG